MAGSMSREERKGAISRDRLDPDNANEMNKFSFRRKHAYHLLGHPMSKGQLLSGDNRTKAFTERKCLGVRYRILRLVV